MPSAARHRYIDPETGDYVVTGGGLKADSGISSKIVLALRMRKGSSALFPTFGSRLHEVKKADESGRRLCEKHAFAALTHLAREVASLDVEAQLVGGGRIDILVSAKQDVGVTSVTFSKYVGG